MPRIARAVIPDVAYHVTQRGNNRQDVFFRDEDRQVYLGFLAEECTAWELTVLGYCLMSNHVHLVAVPHTEQALAKAVGRTHWRYTRYVNRAHERCGHLWQNRFFSCALDEKHTVAAMRYVEQNPVRAGLVSMPWGYRFSSASAHTGRGSAHPVLARDTWRREWAPSRWQRMLDTGLGDDVIESLRRQTLRGRPLGSEAFVTAMEQRLGRRLHPRPAGRPLRGAKPSKIG